MSPLGALGVWRETAPDDSGTPRRALIVQAVISLILVYWAYDEVWSSLLYLRRVWQRTRSWSTLWRVFWGRYDAAGAAVALEAR